MWVGLSDTTRRSEPSDAADVDGPVPEPGAEPSGVVASATAGSVADVGTYLNAGDTFLLTSDTEGMPGAVLEAMVAGLPVVTTNAGGVKEVVSHGEDGFIVEMGDEDSVVSCLADACASTIDHPSIGRVAGLEARRRFSMDKCVESYLTFYRSVVDGE